MATSALGDEAEAAAAVAAAAARGGGGGGGERRCKNCDAPSAQLISTCERFARKKDEEERIREQGDENGNSRGGDERRRREFRSLCVQCVRNYIAEGEMCTLDLATTPLRPEFVIGWKASASDDGAHDGKEEEEEEEVAEAEASAAPTSASREHNTNTNDNSNRGSSMGNRKRKATSDDAGGGSDELPSFCMRFMRGESCKFGDSSGCKFGSHDKALFLSTKPPDIPGSCPWASAPSTCPYGITCRLAASHCGADDTSARVADGDRGAGGAVQKEVNNLFEFKSLQMCLRREEVVYPRCDVYFHANHIKVLKSKKKNRERPKACVASFGDKEERGGARTIDFANKLYLAPLTTVGNLPFRRVCKGMGADITCGEMAMATNLLQGSRSEWALLRRHPSEKIFGVQICGGFTNAVAQAAELVDSTCDVDFIDINMGCPIDLVVNKSAGSYLLQKPKRIEEMVRAASSVISVPLSFKTRIGYFNDTRIDTFAAREVIVSARQWGAKAVTLHGRTRQQRYTKQADWRYIYDVAKETRRAASPRDFQLIGNGDIYTFEDYERHIRESVAYGAADEDASADADADGATGDAERLPTALSSVMIARGALIKPWLFREIKERRHIDISAGERLDLFKDFVRYGLEHWGSDDRGVATTRRFLLEWMSFTHRYVPHGLLDVVPPHLHWRPGSFVARNELETKLASTNPATWIELSELLLGKAPPGFSFIGKHKSNAYEGEANG